MARPISCAVAQASASKEDVEMGMNDSTDAFVSRLAAYPWPRGGVAVERARGGYTLYSQRTGAPLARLKPAGRNDQVQLFWRRRDTWATPGDFGPVILPLDEALDFIASEDFFWINA
jgi:hypothetical protein